MHVSSWSKDNYMLKLTGTLLPDALESIVTQTLVRSVQIRANLILGAFVRPICTLVNVGTFEATE